MYLLMVDRPEIYDHLFAVPNGGLRHPKVAAQLKAEGVKPGVPDLVLAMARDGYHGLYVELKKQGGKTSKVQREWHARLRKAGYKVEVCYGHQDAYEAIENYALEVRDIVESHESPSNQELEAEGP